MLNLFTGSGVGPTILYLALSIFIGLLLGKIKIAHVSLGITWGLFVGIAFSACGVSLNAEMLHVIKEFGLILFVVAVGLQVGPGFFRSFKKGGLAMNLMALVNVALGVLITVIIAKIAHQDLADMAGVYTGAITNTPGLSAAQQAVNDLGIEGGADRLAAGYAVAGNVEHMEFPGLDFGALEQGYLDAVVTFREFQLFPEGAGLVDFHLLAVDSCQVAGVGDADQIVLAVGNGVTAVGAGAADSDSGIDVAKCGEQERRGEDDADMFHFQGYCRLYEYVRTRFARVRKTQIYEIKNDSWLFYRIFES